jgi:hypothetical protein
MSFVLIKGLLLAIPSNEFKKWLKAFYFNNHKALNALNFETVERNGFICCYGTPREPTIEFIMYVDSINERLVKVSIEVTDQEKDAIATQDYVLELIASAILEELVP